MFIFALFYGLEPGYDILLFWNMSTCLNNLDCCRLIVALAEIKNTFLRRMRTVDLVPHLLHLNDFRTGLLHNLYPQER